MKGSWGQCFTRFSVFQVFRPVDVRSQNVCLSLLTLMTRPMMNSPHLAQQGAYRTWKQCSQYLRSSNSKKRSSWKGRKHWAQTKQPWQKSSPLQFTIFALGSKPSSQRAQATLSRFMTPGMTSSGWGYLYLAVAVDI